MNEDKTNNQARTYSLEEYEDGKTGTALRVATICKLMHESLRNADECRRQAAELMNRASELEASVANSMKTINQLAGREVYDVSTIAR
jgi:hypothetical protein